MNKRKVIKLVEPPITSYPAIAYILALKWSEKEGIMPWLSDHFIQLIVRTKHEYTFGDYYDHADLDNHFSIIYGMPGLGWMRVTRDLANFSKFTDYVEYLIDKECCIEACLDRFYFSFSQDYQVRHFRHSTLIYGYDKEKRIIYLADFFDNCRFVAKEASYDEVNLSMNNDWIINLYYHGKPEYKFNKELMRRYFDDYLNSRDSFCKYEFSNREYNRYGVRFGLAYYDYLIERLMTQDDLDLRMIHVLYDHKKLMKYRLKFLQENALFDFEQLERLLAENEKIFTDVETLRALAIRFSIEHREDIKKKIISRVQEVKEEDAEFVRGVLALYNN